MALISRLHFLHGHCWENILFCPVTRISLRCFSHKILCNIKSTQTLPTLQQRYQSTNKEFKQKVNEFTNVKVTTGDKLSAKARLKQAVRDYGATVIVFHVVISLASLGTCYVAVSSGIDAVSILARLGFPESVVSNEVLVGGSTFLMAYAVHKAFAPVRIVTTLSCVPFIVRYLRKINVLKPPK